MTLESKLKELILKEHKSLRAFTKHINEPYSTIDTMLKRENGISGAAVTTVIKICKALDIETEALESGKILKRSVTIDAILDQEENEHIENYRKLTKSAKIVIDITLNSLLDYESEQQEKSIQLKPQIKQELHHLDVIAAHNGNTDEDQVEKMWRDAMALLDD